MEKYGNVTVAALRSMHIGQTRAFKCNDYSKCLSGRNTCYYYARVLGCRFRVCIDPDTLMVMVTKTAKEMPEGE